jgi:multidrug efflux pump subunit AcrA (membrane-fusion protein)
MHDDDHDQGREIDGHIEIDAVAARNLGLKTRAVEPEFYYDRIKIPGMTVVDPDRRLEISAPANVRILELDTRVPATVCPGERLALLELADAEIRDLQLQAVETRARQLSDRTEQERLRRYLDGLREAQSPAEAEIERVAADLRVVEGRLAAQESALDGFLAALRTAGLSESQLRALAEEGQVATQLVIRAPEVPGISDFEVTDRPVHRGETVAAGATLFQLESLDQLWVLGEAFEADLAIVRRAVEDELPVTLVFPAEERQVGDLRILALEGEQDGVNRVTHFFVRLPNVLAGERTVDGLRYQQWVYRAGARVQVMVATQAVGQRYVIPATSLVRQAGQAWVFIHDSGEYLRIPVIVESVGPREAVLPLDCGLRRGDELVVSGALQLNLTLDQQHGPEAVDPHAGHSH